MSILEERKATQAEFNFNAWWIINFERDFNLLQKDKKNL